MYSILYILCLRRDRLLQSLKIYSCTWCKSEENACCISAFCAVAMLFSLSGWKRNGVVFLRKWRLLGVSSFPGRVETISTSNGLTQQKTSDTAEPEQQAQFRIAIVESERLKSGLVRDSGIKLWVKQKPCLKRKKSVSNEKWQTENSRTQAERGFSGQFRTAPAPPAEPGAGCLDRKNRP